MESSKKYYFEIDTQVKELKTKNFEIKSLRTALEIYKKAYTFYLQKKITKQEFENLNLTLKEIIGHQFQLLNPKLSKNIINKLCKCYERNDYICLPLDLTVINNEAVFYLEGNYANPYEQQILLLEDNSKPNFTEINNLNIDNKNVTDLQIINQIIKKLNLLFTDKKTSINYQNNETKYNGYSYTRMFINPNFNQLLNELKLHNKTSLKVITLNDWNNFNYYLLNIKLNKDNTLKFIYETAKSTSWNLNQALTTKNQKNNKPSIFKRTKQK